MKLYDHQAKVVEICRERKRHAFFLEQGTGKTIALLSVCHDRPMRTLVLCPRSVMRAAWLRDSEHFPFSTRCLWHASKAERRRLIAGGWDVGVLNFESFKTMIPELRAAGVRRLIVDESSKIKNHASAVSRAVVDFSTRVDECYLLSGTPAPNNGTEYWPQIRCIDPRWSGPSFWAWSHRYFIPQKRKISGREVITGWTQNKVTAPEFAGYLRQCSWVLTKAECLDLPEKIDQIRSVPLGDEAEAYRGAEDDLRLLDAEGETQRIKAEAALIKLRQITGGGVLVNGEAVEVGSAKLSALRDVLEEAGDVPAVIWAEFTHEIDRIVAALRTTGAPVDYIDGRSSSRAGDIAAAFQAGQIKYLVCHPQAAGHGITLTAASLAVYYSLSFSSELHLQSRDRIHRAGQTRACLYVYLIAEDTVDESMLRSLRGKKSRADAITDALRVRAVPGVKVCG